MRYFVYYVVVVLIGLLIGAAGGLAAAQGSTVQSIAQSRPLNAVLRQTKVLRPKRAASHIVPQPRSSMPANLSSMAENSLAVEVTLQWSREIRASSTGVLAGDVNGDGKVNIVDRRAVAGNWRRATLDWRADVNKDGVVDIYDLLIIARNFGRRR